MAEEQPVGQEGNKESGSWKKWHVGGVISEVETVFRPCCGCSLDGVKGKEFKQQNDTKAALLHIHCAYGDA